MKFPVKTYLECLEKAALLFEDHNLNLIEYRTLEADLLKELRNLTELNNFIASMISYKLIDEVENTVDDTKPCYVLSPVVGDYFHTKQVLASDAYKCLVSVPVFEKTFDEFGSDTIPSLDTLFNFWKNECGVFIVSMKTLHDIYTSNLEFYHSCPKNLLNKNTDENFSGGVCFEKAKKATANTTDENDFDIFFGNNTTTSSTDDRKNKAVSATMMDMWRLIEGEVTPKVNAGQNKKELLIQLEDMGDTLKFIKARIETLKRRLK